MTFAIERKECGVWELLDEADDLETAIQLASSHAAQPCAPAAESAKDDARIQIVTPTGEIL